MEGLIVRSSNFVRVQMTRRSLHHLRRSDARGQTNKKNNRTRGEQEPPGAADDDDDDDKSLKDLVRVSAILTSGKAAVVRECVRCSCDLDLNDTAIPCAFLREALQLWDEQGWEESFGQCS